jgi:tetratricopeptide (TPR) repeat protein
MNASALSVRRIRELTECGRYSDALAALDALAAQAREIEHRDVLFLRAVNERYLNRVADALHTLERLEQRHTRFARLYQERGHCYAMLGQRKAALDAFECAVQMNPTLANSWRVLAWLHRQAGDFKRAAAALEQLALLQRQPAEMLRAGSLFCDGDLQSAEQVLRSYLASAPGDAEARRLLVRILLRAQRFASARAEADHALKIDAESAHARALCAAACVALGDHHAAIALHERILAGQPDSAQTRVLLGHSYRATAQPQQAIAAYRAALALRPDFGDAFWSLANLKTYRFSDQDVALMLEGASAASTGPIDQYHLCFALGREFETRGEYARCWDFYQRGNALKGSEASYLAAAMDARAGRLIEVCSSQLFARRGALGAEDPDPIFIVGLPRSGSTLIEQILASHSQVEATLELAEIARLAAELKPYPERLADLAAPVFQSLGKRYLYEAQAYRREQARGKVRFIDKMPNNFWHIGLIRLMLPNAKIIDVRREPMACCLSNFKQLYASGQEFSYDLKSLAHYYRTYLKVMGHWERVLPGALLRVHYEDVVEDLAGSVRRILEFCGLEHEPECLEFHATRRSITSASSEQVRRPIFTEGTTHWRNFETWLAPLTHALGAARESWRD